MSDTVAVEDDADIEQGNLPLVHHFETDDGEKDVDDDDDDNDDGEGGGGRCCRQFCSLRRKKKSQSVLFLTVCETIFAASIVVNTVAMIMYSSSAVMLVAGIVALLIAPLVGWRLYRMQDRDCKLFLLPLRERRRRRRSACGIESLVLVVPVAFGICSVPNFIHSLT